MYRITYTANVPGVPELHGTRRSVLFATGYAFDAARRWRDQVAEMLDVTLELWSDGAWRAIAF